MNFLAFSRVNVKDRLLFITNILIDYIIWNGDHGLASAGSSVMIARMIQ